MKSYVKQSEYDIDCHCGLSFGAERLYDEYNPKDTLYIGFDLGVRRVIGINTIVQSLATTWELT